MSQASPNPPRECDVAVIGAGILGLAVARELTRRRSGERICVLEREPTIAAHQSGHSSGVIHSGIYYAPGSLKARLCVRGSRALYEYCAERGIEVRRAGQLIVASHEGELERLAELERRGRENGVELARLDRDEIREVEPHATGLAALHSPATGIVDFAAVSRALAEELNGRVHCGCPVGSLAASAAHLELRHGAGRTRARAAIFCAGLWSDRLARMAGAPADPRIVPFRGAYLRVLPERADLVRANVYPVPDPELPFLGAHLTHRIDGQLLIGPSALIAPGRDAYRLWRVRPRDAAETIGWPGTWRLAARHWRAGASEIRRAASRAAFVAEAARYVPELRRADVRAGPVGIRAQALGRDGRLVEDFVLHQTERALHVRNAPSPAATSALALAELICDRLEDLR